MLRHLGNSENRVSAAQSRLGATAPMRRRLAGPPSAVGPYGHYSDMVHRLFFGRVAEWQTRWLQVPVSFGTWGFKSPFAHQHNCRSRPLNLRDAAVTSRVTPRLGVGRGHGQKWPRSCPFRPPVRESATPAGGLRATVRAPKSDLDPLAEFAEAGCEVFFEQFQEAALIMAGRMEYQVVQSVTHIIGDLGHRLIRI